MNISRVSLVSSLRKGDQGRCVVLPLFEEHLSPTSPLPVAGFLFDSETWFELRSFLKDRSFDAKAGAVVYHSPAGRLVIVVGMGSVKSATAESFRRVGSYVWPVLRALSVQHVLVADVECDVDLEVRASSLVEGFCLSSYVFDKYMSSKGGYSLTSLGVVVGRHTKVVQQAVQDAVELCDVVGIVRDLVNDPSEEMTPLQFAKEVRQLGKQFGCSVKVLTDAQIAAKGMTLIDTVGRASAHSNRFVVMTYRGPGVAASTTPVALVGKGVTFDTGGVNLKPSNGGFLEEMHTDMAGAATVLGAVLGCAALKIPVAVSVVMPLAENALGGDAYKPGSVLQSYAGKTVEIANTDAEGRLLLADALHYAVKDLKASTVVDVATLTGACMVALGTPCAGLVSNNDALTDALRASGDRVYERVWPLPLYEEYRADVKSDIADVRNMGKLGGGRFAGAITAATFLEHFIGEETRWAHIDIAGTATSSSAVHYAGPGATGFGVRLLVDFLRTHLS